MAVARLARSRNELEGEGVTALLAAVGAESSEFWNELGGEVAAVECLEPGWLLSPSFFVLEVVERATKVDGVVMAVVVLQVKTADDVLALDTAKSLANVPLEDFSATTEAIGERLASVVAFILPCILLRGGVDWGDIERAGTSTMCADD